MPLSLLANIMQSGWDVLKVMPTSTIFIFGLTTALGLATSLINKKMTDMKEYKRLQIEQAKVNKEIMDAAKSGNQRITHSRKTMSIGDQRYGVTMEEPSVCKLVSVRFT